MIQHCFMFDSDLVLKKHDNDLTSECNMSIFVSSYTIQCVFFCKFWSAFGARKMMAIPPRNLGVQTAPNYEIDEIHVF